MNSNSFLQYLEFEKRYSPHTLTAYRKDLTQFQDFLVQMYELTDWAEVEHLHVRSWMVDLLESGCRERTINRKLSALKSFFKYQKARGWMEHNPMQKVIAPKSGKRLPSFLRESEVQHLLAPERFTADFGGLRDRLLLCILYEVGLRRSELIDLTDQSFDRSSMLVRVKGKGGKVRLVPVQRSLVELMESYRQCRANTFGPDAPRLLLTDAGKPLYPKLVYNLVRRYLGQVTTAERRSPHVLRHTFATHLTNNGADLNAVKGLLGHSSLAATQLYTHNTIEKLKAVYQKAHPKGGEPED